jgi:hypothetical protein
MLTLLKKSLRALGADRRGNVAIVAAVAMPVLLGSMGIGAEVASWYTGKRNLQNAADSAAIAAATNADPSNYQAEALSVARKYGLQNGVDGVTVSAVNNAACPEGGNTCYRVNISRVQPLLLAQVVGFQGDLRLDGLPAKRISATALAYQAYAPRDYCVLALAGSGATEGIRANGSPNADLTGCSTMSNTSANCNGHTLKAEYSDAHVTSAGCGRRNTSNVDVVADPFASKASNIAANPCKNPDYSWIPTQKNDPALKSTNTFHGLDSRTSISICGDAQLDGPTLLTGGNVVITVYGGSLDLKGYTLQTMPGTTATIVFTGPQNSDHMHIPMGTGMLDIQAPTSGPWKGVAIYQDPALAAKYVEVKEAGNAPAWNITGLVYLSKATVTFSGIVNKSSYGKSCFGLVTDNLTVNGTAEILAHGECPQAGLGLPTSNMPSRGQLVS